MCWEDEERVVRDLERRRRRRGGDGSRQRRDGRIPASEKIGTVGDRRAPCRTFVRRGTHFSHFAERPSRRLEGAESQGGGDGSSMEFNYCFYKADPGLATVKFRVVDHEFGRSLSLSLSRRKMRTIRIECRNADNCSSLRPRILDIC